MYILRLTLLAAGFVISACSDALDCGELKYEPVGPAVSDSCGCDPATETAYVCLEETCSGETGVVTCEDSIALGRFINLECGEDCNIAFWPGNVVGQVCRERL